MFSQNQRKQNESNQTDFPLTSSTSSSIALNSSSSFQTSSSIPNFNQNPLNSQFSSKKRKRDKNENENEMNAKSFSIFHSLEKSKFFVEKYKKFNFFHL